MESLYHLSVEKAFQSTALLVSTVRNVDLRATVKKYGPLVSVALIITAANEFIPIGG